MKRAGYAPSPNIGALDHQSPIFAQVRKVDGAIDLCFMTPLYAPYGSNLLKYSEPTAVLHHDNVTETSFPSPELEGGVSNGLRTIFPRED